MDQEEASLFDRTNTQAPSTGVDGISLLNSLLSSINSKSVPRRALFSSVPLEIGPGFKVSVTGYIILKRQEPARSCYVWVGGERPQIAKGVTTQIVDDTARTVEKWEIRKAYKFGGEQISFTPEEQKSLRDFGEPVIRIIGFKSVSALPFWASIKPPTFIYPSEETYVGSTRVFSALHQKLLNNQKMALVWFIARKNAAPVVAAMLPSAEKLDENSVQKLPPGMWLLPLPFADDIRPNPETNVVVAPEPLIDRMRAVVELLHLPKSQYAPHKYPNPSLQWHYRILQALALDEDLPEKPEDKATPKYKQIDKRVGDHVIAWGKELEEQDRNLFSRNSKTAAIAKRPAKTKRVDGDSTESTPAPKRIKTERDGLGVADEVRKCYESGTLSKLTMPVLKDFLSLQHLPTSGKKADLVERVEDFYDRKG